MTPPSVFPLPLRLYGGLREIELAVEEGVVDRVTGLRLCARIRALLEARAA